MKLKRANGETLDVGGYHFEEVPKDAPRFTALPGRVLPAKVDLRPLLSAVEDQRGTQSCTANAAAGAYEYLMRRHRDAASYEVSRLFIYYNARELDGTSAADGGAKLRLVIESLVKHGACSEDLWRFEKELVNQKPSDDAYEQGKQFLIEGAEHIPLEWALWEEALAEGHPILFALRIFEGGSFANFSKPGYVPLPTKEEAKRKSEPHAMLCVGYSHDEKHFIVRNSWGAQWGVGGYCYIPYRYVMTYALDSSWIIKHVSRLEPDRSTWHDDGVLDPIDTLLSRMPEEDCAKMRDAMGEHPFELRLALLFLRSAAADGILHEAELSKVAEVLAPVLERTGGHHDAAGIVRFAFEHLNDEKLINESIELFSQFFSTKELVEIASPMRGVNDADGDLAEKERAFARRIARAWWVEGGKSPSSSR